MELKKEQSQITFDRQAEQYDTSFYGRHARTLYEPLLQRIKELSPSSVLDLGCGTGVLLMEIAGSCPASRLSGLDLSSAMLNEAQKRLCGRAELTLGDSEDLPYADHVFDLIVCCDSFHHYPHPRAVLTQLHRCLRSGGMLLIGDSTMPPGLRQLMNFSLPFSRQGDVRLYSRKEMQDLMAGLFQPVKWKRMTMTHYILEGGVMK